jgi:hypothetical protein
MRGLTSGTVTLKVGAIAGTYNLILPSTVGGAGSVLTSQAGGSNAMTWTSLAAVATSGSAADLGSGTLLAARMPALTGDCTSTVGTVATSCKSRGPMTGAPNSSVTQNSTIYTGTSGACGTEVNCALVWPISGTLKNLNVTANQAAGAGQSYTFTLRIAASDKTLTCTISGASPQTCTDSTHTEAITAGQLYSIKTVSSVTATNNAVVQWVMEFDNP